MAVIDSKKQERDEFDELMVHIGVNGKFQLRFNLLFNMLFVLIFSICCFNVYIALTVPGHWCHVPGRNETNYTIEEWKEMNIPKDESGYGFRKCQMYNTTVTYNHTIFEELEEHRSIIDCQHGWEYDTTWYKMTVPTQEDWVCDKELYVANSLFAARAGEALGSLVFGHLGDTMGRRPVLFIAVATMVVGRCLSVLVSGTYYLFLLFCFIGNSSVVTVFVAPLVIGVELSSSEKRSHIAMLQFFGWTGGTCTLTVLAWITGGEWKAMLLVSSLPSLLIFTLHKMFPESPRWLASSGKTAECEKVLSNIAHVNGNTLPENTFTILKKADQAKEGHFGVGSLFSSWRLARNTFLVCSCIVLCHLIYYTVILQVTGMSGNPYLNFFLQAVVEFPGFILGRIISDKLGRRWTQGTAYMLSALCLLLITTVTQVGSLQWLVTSLVVGVKFLITITVYVGYLLNTEIYPICVRQSGSSVGFTGSGTLGVVAPYIAYLGSAVGVNYPYFILAGLALLGAVCSLLLPETLNEKLPETLADAAQFGLNQKFWSLPSRQRGQMKATELKTEEL